MTANPSVENRHTTFWFEGGSLVLYVQGCAFKVHKDVFCRHSRLDITGIEHTEPATSDPQEVSCNASGDLSACVHYFVAPERNVRSEDVTVLLDYLYYNPDISSSTPFPRLASLIRVTSPKQLDLPQIHEASVNHFIKLFPDVPTPLDHQEDLVEALSLALEFQVLTVQKRLFYSYVTASNLDLDESSLDSTSPQVARAPISEEGQLGGVNAGNAPEEVNTAPNIRILPPAQLKRCHDLMTSMVEHFTPMLFTPATTPHMACTDVFADTWMNVVIQPAIEDDGVCKPLETLERIKNVDWAAYGLCADCVREKKTEWNEEQLLIWNLMDKWLGVGPSAGQI